MEISFIQRFQDIPITYRVPALDTECYRLNALVGPRITWLWEKFKWRAVSQDVNGLTTSSDIADYTNVVSNRLYGLNFGGGYECFLGDTPLGALALSVEGQGGAYLDLVKGRANWDREDRAIGAHRSRNFATIAPGAQGNVKLWWYPIEAVEVFAGYDAEIFFNTMASRHPIDFDMSAITPGFDKGVTRFFHGFRFGFGVTF